MTWLKPAIVFTAVSSGVLAGTFLYVWLSSIRRRYVLLWSFAWLAAVPHLVFTWVLLDRPASYPVWALQQLCLVLNAFLMVAGCYEFVHRRLPVGTLAAFAAPFLLWAAAGPAFTDRFLEIGLPNSLLLGASYLWTASRFLVLRRERGSRLALPVAILFAVAGAHEFDYPFLGNLPWAAPFGYALASVLAISISLCLLILVLEESRAEAHEERARIKAILDNLPVGVLVTTAQGEVLLANGLARSMLGGRSWPAAADSKGLEVQVFRNPDGTACDSRDLPLARALRTGLAAPARELAMTAPDGTSRAVLVNAGPVRDEKGTLIGAVAVFQDIEGLKRIQAEMARAERLQGLGTLAAGVAHDFNNALALIMGHAEMALRAADDPVLRQQIEMISRVASDSAAIVRRIQDLARARTSRDNVVFDLSAIVREAVDMTRPRWRDEAQAKGVHFEVRTDLEHEAVIAGQPAEIREAVFNLILNALDAMPGGGVLAFCVGRKGTEAVLSVSDSGSGMPPEIAEKIFDPFFTTKGPRGTGLGLAVVFGIVQRHEGSIAVDSRPGRGTTFTLRFPLRTAPALPAGERPRAAATVRRRILFVDDQAAIRQMTEDLLGGSGHEVTSVESGAEALRLVAERDFDIVLTDLGMPEMNGWEVAAAVRRLRPAVPIVLVTGWGETVPAEEAARNGITRILSKPFSLEQILASIDMALRPDSFGSLLH